MPYARPTISDLRSQVATDIATAKPGADALLRFANLQILGKAQAGLAYGQYGYLDWISLQSVPFTATGEYLEGWAALKKIFRKSPKAATGTATWPGTPGTDLPAGTSCLRGDGTSYTTQADATVGGGGTVTASILADVAAAAGNADAGTVLTLDVAINGIQSTGAAATALTGGADIEDDDSLRSRMLAEYQSPPQGGDVNDYVEWALQVPGVTRAWCTPNGMGPGTVVIYTMFDLSEESHQGFPQGTNGGAASEPRISPATGDQLAVANYIYPLQPVTALVYSVAPVAEPINFTISGLSTAGTTIQDEVEAAISGVFTLNGSPKAGSMIDLSDIESAINAVPGTEGFVITSPTANISTSTGSLPTLGTTTWT